MKNRSLMGAFITNRCEVFKDTTLILNSEPQEDGSSQVSKEVGRIHLACRELPHLKEDIIR